MLQEGDRVTLPKLADTYEKVAREGAQAFYSGSLADQIVKDVQEAGELVSSKPHCSGNPSLAVRSCLG